ncbi:MAG: YggS family pyridoxal phosphate-dependent enzyme [Sodalis sp. (in: enterobacteria)]
MSIIEQNLRCVHRQIRTTVQNCGRDSKEITLIAVSKTKPLTAIEDAINAGQRAFRENYVHEAIKKIKWFRKRIQGTELIWHFIGQLQSNKTHLVAKYFDWYQTLDRPQIVGRINNQRPVEQAALNVLIQINISYESTNAGIDPDQMLMLAAHIGKSPRLRLRGLMAIPLPEVNFHQQLAGFKRISRLYKVLKRIYPGVDTLSIGMTKDMPAAIVAGSTLVRIGNVIFGDRD